jgi:hypothetical protein
VSRLFGSKEEGKQKSSHSDEEKKKQRADSVAYNVLQLDFCSKHIHTWRTRTNNSVREFVKFCNTVSNHLCPISAIAGNNLTFGFFFLFFYFSFISSQQFCPGFFFFLFLKKLPNFFFLKKTHYRQPLLGCVLSPQSRQNKTSKRKKGFQALCC